MIERIRARRHDLLALVVAVIAISLFHARGIRPGYTFLPVDLANNLYPWRTGEAGEALQNPLITDPLFEFYPYLSFAVDTVRETHSWPLWNPGILLGHPAFADPVTQTFYPAYLLLGLVLGTARALAIGPWLHAVLAACFTYGFLRTLGCGPRPALLGALAYALSGHMVTWFETRQWISTLTWLPAVLWAFELAMSRRRWPYLALAALCTGLALLGGQVQLVVAFAVFLLGYAALRAMEEQRRGYGQGPWPLVGASFILLMGGALAAIQLLPLAELLPLSLRSADTSLLDSLLEPRQLITLLVPDFFGNPATVGEYWGQWNYSEGTIYAGVTVLFLAMLAPLTTRRRRFLAAGLSGMALVAVYFIVGSPGVALLDHLPLAQFVSPGRSAFLLPLLAAILAALTVDEAESRGMAVVVAGVLLATVAGLAYAGNWGLAQEHAEQLQQPISRAALLLAAAVIVMLLRTRLPRWRGWWEWALAALVFVDLFLAGSHFNPAGPIEELLPPHPATDYLQANAGDQRVAPYLLGWNHISYGPNILSTYGIAEPGGYSSLVPGRLQQLFQAGDSEGQHWNILGMVDPSTRLLDLFQVAYAASAFELDDSEVRAEVPAVGCTGSTGEITASAPVSGTFTVVDTAINRLDVQFRHSPAGPEAGELLIRLWQGENRERQVLEARQPVAELPDQQPVTWYFAAEEDAAGRAYLWEVAAAGDAAHTGSSLCTDDAGRPAVAVYGSRWGELFQDPIYLHRRYAPMPRAYVVYGVEAVPDDAEAISRLLDEAFDLRRGAVVAEPVDLPETSDLPATPAQIASYTPSRVVVQATAVEQGLLVLGDLYYPGWQATIDGQPAEIVRANYVMRGVVVPAGAHTVEYRLAPASLRQGALVSLGAVLLLAALVLGERVLRRRGRRWPGN